MSCIFVVELGDNEMVSYNSEYNVWNGKFGLNNQGTDPVKVDSSDGAIVVKTPGIYRVTGQITGVGTPNAVNGDRARGYINLPPDQLDKDPSYPDPSYFVGFDMTTSTRMTAPFSGKVSLTTFPKFTFYLTKNFTNIRAWILFELVQS
jgi:hypothetical protein